MSNAWSGVEWGGGGGVDLFENVGRRGSSFVYARRSSTSSILELEHSVHRAVCISIAMQQLNVLRCSHFANRTLFHGRPEKAFHILNPTKPFSRGFRGGSSES